MNGHKHTHIASVLTAFSMTITAIVLAITGIIGRKGGGSAASGSSKDEITIKPWINRLAYTLRRLAGKAAEALSTIVGSVLVLF